MVALIAHGSRPANTFLLESWRRLGIDVELLAPEQALARLHAGDVAVNRLDVLPSVDGVEPGLLAVIALRARGVRVLNAPRELVAAHDKLITARLLRRAGVPHPTTVHLPPRGPLPAVSLPCVLKPRFGSWGKGIVRCETAADLDAALTAARATTWFVRHGALLQELVAVRGRDLRLLMAGGHAVGGVERIAHRGEWRTNVALGARRVPLRSVPDRARELAAAAVEAVGGDLVGIDLLPVRGDYVVLELNGSVDFAADYGLPGRDVYADVAGALGIRA